MAKETSDLLASTSSWTAAVRAKESERPDGLFNDPWAGVLAGKTGEQWISGRSPDSIIPIVLRTRFFDDFLVSACGRDGVCQVVLLAAGLDTRAFRLNWPDGTRLFEIDRESVLRRKEQILSERGACPRCARYAIGTDLTSRWTEKLLAAGFKNKEPAVFLLEGFLFYIPNEETARLLDDVTSFSRPGSWLGFDVMNTHMLTSPWTQKWVEMQAAEGAPWIGTMDDPVDFVARRGWKAKMTQAGAEDANHGRWPFPVIPTKMPGMPHNWFVTANRE